MKGQQLVGKRWCNETAATNNLKCEEIFTQWLPRKLKDSAHKLKVKHTSTVIEPSIPLHTVVNFAVAEDLTKRKIGDQPLEIDNVTSKLESQNLSAETYDPNPEIVF